MLWRGSTPNATAISSQLTRRLKINARSVRRWKVGTRPGPGHLVALFNLAAAKGVLHILLPSAGEPESVETAEAGVERC